MVEAPNPENVMILAVEDCLMKNMKNEKMILFLTDSQYQTFVFSFGSLLVFVTVTPKG